MNKIWLYSSKIFSYAAMCNILSYIISIKKINILQSLQNTIFYIFVFLVGISVDFNLTMFL